MYLNPQAKKQVNMVTFKVGLQRWRERKKAIKQ